MKKTNIIISCTLSAVMAASASLGTLCALAEEPPMVHFIVENQTFPAENGSPWEGTLLDEWVSIGEADTAASLFESLISDKGLTQTGAADGYITEIGGLKAGDGSTSGGWMLLYNDCVDDAITAYTVPAGTLGDGDELRFSYSLDWGADIGYDWMGTDTSLSTLSFSAGTLSPAFSPEETEYTLTLSQGTGSVSVDLQAKNKAFRAKIFKNTYALAKTEYKKGKEIPVVSGDTIWIGLGHPGFQSYLSDGISETVYQIHVQSDTPVESSDLSSQPSTEPEESSQGERPEVLPEEMLKALTEKALEQPERTAPGSEWTIMTLARCGCLSGSDREAYLKNLALSLQETGLSKATDSARVLIAVTAAGADGQHFAGMDLTEPLADMEYVSRQGLNGVVYTLIALDTHSYEIPEAADPAHQTTRDKLIAEILSAQLPDGGWTFFGDVYDPDMTAMALTALAPYCETNEAVQTAVQKAVFLLSEVQTPEGTYSSFGQENADSTAQVITALTALGISPAEDARFLKENGSVLGGLSGFYLSEEKGFSHAYGEAYNGYTTVQAFYALCAWDRFQKEQPSLFDMNEVTLTAYTLPETSEESPASHPSSVSQPEASVESTASSAQPATGDGTIAPVLLVLLLSGGALLAISKKPSRKSR